MPMRTDHGAISTKWQFDRTNHSRRLCVTFVLIVFIGSGACTSKLYTHPALVVNEQAPSGEVYFFRETHFAGSAFATLVRLDEENLLRLRSGTYTSVRLRPDLYIVDVAVSTGGAQETDTGITWEEGSRMVTVEPEITLYVVLRFTSTRQNQLLFYPDLITEAQAKALMAEYELISAD
jgi:hypothetical protein